MRRLAEIYARAAVRQILQEQNPTKE